MNARIDLSLSRREFLKASGALIVSATGIAFAGEALAQSASQKLGLPVEQLRVDDGVVSAVSDPAKKASYAELIGGRHFNRKVEWNKQTGNAMDIKVEAKPKSPSEYRVVGKSFTRRDLPGKVYRTDKYVTDISLP